MKATELLENQHREVERLFDAFENAEGSEKRRIFSELATAIVGHDAIEREIFYPACQRQMGKSDLLGEALVEHGVVEFSLFKADTARRPEDLEACVKVLKDVLEHHIEEEEHELFPKVTRALGGARNEKLGVRLEERFAEVIEEDFRTLLYPNLRQVVAGAVATKPVAKTRASRAGMRAAPAAKRVGAKKRGAVAKRTRAGARR
jgi:hemerythrin-like domain-containing protein